MDGQQWVRFAAQLAEMPDVTARLLADHTDDGNGRCRACTTPGRGTPQALWPCSMVKLAFAAESRARRRLGA